jgi:hypothetical protein
MRISPLTRLTRLSACAWMLTVPTFALVGCVATTEVEEPSLPQEWLLAAYNGEDLPYSGVYTLVAGESQVTLCYEVDYGELVMRNGMYRVSVEGRTDQECESGWSSVFHHAGSGEYNVVGDSIAFRDVPGLRGVPQGWISNDTLTMTITPLPALASRGVRTLTFVPR